MKDKLLTPKSHKIELHPHGGKRLARAVKPAARTGPQTLGKPVAYRLRKTRSGEDALRRGEVTGSRAKTAEVNTVEWKTKSPRLSLVEKTRQRRSELMISELEAVALAMFEERGFATVNVEEIAAEAQISTRTFYRYLPAKEDVLQVRIRRRAEALRDALAERPTDELPLHSLRLAVDAAFSAEDPVLLKRWIAVVAATPSALRAVLGGCILILNGMLAEFFGSRLNVPADALVPTMLAAAASGIIKAAESRWLVFGGNLATTTSESLRVLEEAVDTGLCTRTTGKGRGNNK
jgi:TetR/AcrR family transcriptional regulator, regulator of mycofactocin system